MDYKIEEGGAIIKVRISGVLTFDDHERFKSVVKAINESDSATAEIDLGETKMIDSAGIGMLLLANDRAKKAGKEVRLTGANGHVLKVIQLSKVDEIIPVES
ncbi:STAS domain-containing protein [Maricaulis sp.]|uniref:STAS domain-containing protein n=1 Tax=Maricaulis sp. TaxID=1486257 RepID=UPI00262E98D2|nr:STAS domain-containing protein [Maricaulis sp.]